MKRRRKTPVTAAVCRIMAFSLVLCLTAPCALGAAPSKARPGAETGETEFSGTVTETEETGFLATEPEDESEREQVLVRDVKDLEALAKRCGVDTNSKHFLVLLEEDISLSGKKFTPVPFFSGVFDGQGHTIKGISIRSDGSNQGLFRYVGAGAEIRNLNVEGWIEPGADAKIIGGIAGNNAGMIRNCSFGGSVRALEDGGGIAGINAETGTILGCSFRGKTVAQHRAGGIAGQNAGSILNCTSRGEVNTEYIETDAEKKSSLTAELTDLSSFDVSSVSKEDFVDIMDIGGIAGFSEGLISECRNEGTVGYAHSGYNVGGIAGRSSGFTVSCSNDAAVYGRRDVGGILGQLEPESIWEYSRSRTEELKNQLLQLNAQLDALAADVSGTSEELREDVRAASGYATETIRNLQGITNDVGGDLEQTSAAITEATGQLQAAVDEQDAQALKTALAELARIIAETDFFRQPVNVTVKGNAATDLDSVLNAKEADWWKKLDQYLNSRENSSGQGASVPVQDPSQTGSADMGAGSIGTGTGDGSGEDTGSVDENAAEGLFDDGQADAGYSGEEYADTGAADAASDPGALTQPDESSWEDISGQYAADDSIVVDEDAGSVIPEESIMTGSGMEEPEADGGDAVIQDDGSDGIPVLDVGTDLEQTVSAGDNASAGRSHTSDVQVNVDGNLPDTTQLRSLLNTVLTDSAALLDPAALANALEILKGLQVTPPDTESFYANFRNLSESAAPIADDARSLAGKTAADIDAITDQLDRITESFFSLTQNLSLDERYTQTDVSRQNPYQSDDSSVESCKNTGEVNGDANTGGIAGCIGFENRIDAEGVLDVSQYLLKDAQYTIFASIRKSCNRGAVTAKKENAGGIVGYMEFGIVTDCANTGAVTVQEGDCCGGISGKSQGTITACCAGSLLTGGAYTGGIAGLGTNIIDCISYSYIDSSREYLGAVAGSAQGEVSGCRYVDYGIGGIDNIGYAAAARPLPSVSAMASTGNAAGGDASGTKAGSGGAQDDGAWDAFAGNTCTVSFVVEDEVFQEVKVPFGGSLEELPQVPNKGDDYWEWDDFDREHIFSDQTVTGAYHRAAATLASEGDVPDYLVEGVFYEGQKLTVADYAPAESPISTESIADLIGEKIHGSKETETEAGKNLERIITDRLTGPLLDAKTLSVNDYDRPLTARVRAQSGGRLFTAPAGDDAALQETPYTKDGSYIVFGLENGGSFAYYESLRQNKDMRVRIAVICGIAAALLLILIILIRKHRKNRKSKGRKQPEKPERSTPRPGD